MQMNLKTTLKAFPKLSPSILENYVTKTELEEKQYIDSDILSNTLLSYVREVDNGDPSTIYGRQDGKWVPVVEMPESTSGILCWGMLDSPFVNDMNFLKLHRKCFINGVEEYRVEDRSDENGFFYFISTSPILQVMSDSNLCYKQPLVELPALCIDYMGKHLNFFCYRTTKLIASPDSPYRFKVQILLR